MSHHIFELKNKRDSLRETVDALYEVLKSHNATMNTPLTVDGFPRADIDVTQIRTTRHQIIRMENDIAGIQKELEEAVMNHWSSNTNSAESTVSEACNGTKEEDTSKVEPQIPFATVYNVTEGSPAATAGIMVDDRIVRLGTVQATTPRIPQALPEAVIEGNEIEVVVIRGDETVTLSLLPAKWDGTGLIGAAFRLL